MWVGAVEVGVEIIGNICRLQKVQVCKGLVKQERSGGKGGRGGVNALACHILVEFFLVPCLVCHTYS